MPPASYSFIDVAVLDDVRERFVRGDAIAILSTDLAEIIWANGPGAALFGQSDIEAAIGADSGLGLSARRQIASTRGFPHIGRDRSVMVRLTRGVVSRAQMFMGSAISMPDGEDAILLAVPAEREPEPAARRSASIIGGFTQPGHLVALLDSRGAIEAASEGFPALGIAPQALADLTRDVAREPDRLIKRIVSGKAARFPAGIARLSDNPVRHLLMVVDERETDAVAPDILTAAAAAIDVNAREDASERPDMSGLMLTGDAKPLPDHAGKQGEIEPALPMESAEEANTDITGTSGEAVAPATRQDEEAFAPDTPVVDAISTAAFTPSDGPQAAADKVAGDEQPEEDRIEVAEADSVVEQDESREPETILEDEAEAAQRASPPADGEVGLAAATEPEIARAAPLRFVWRTDAEGRFSALSPEFVSAVGSAAGDVIGQSFADVSDRLGLDPRGEIAGLLSRRDTWSGRSVLWPVAATDLKVPVDLAALPVYSRDRTFEGFRGFGVARMADVVMDPEAVGLKLEPDGAIEAFSAASVGLLEADEGESGGEDAPVDPFQGEVPALIIAPLSDQRFSDKIIKLAEHRPPGPEKALSPVEKVAFREIGDRLKKAEEADRASPAGGSADAANQNGPEDAQGQTVPPADIAVNPPADNTGMTTPGIARSVEDDADIHREEEPQLAPEAEPDFFETQSPAVEDAARHDAVETEVSEPEAVERDTRTPDLFAVDEHAPKEDPAGAHGEDEGEPAATEFEQAAEEDYAPSDFEGWSELTPPVEEAEAEADFALAAGHEPAFTGADETDPAPHHQGTAILERLPVPILVHSGDLLHYANAEFLDLTGYASVEALAEAGGLGALFAEPYEDEASDDTDHALRLRTAEGQEFSIEALLRAVPWQGARALMLVVRRTGEAGAPLAAPLLEISERDDLKARLAEMRTIIDTATDGVILIDSEGMIRSISRPAEALFGYEADDIQGKPFVSLFAMESQRAARDYLASLSENGVGSVLNDGREVIGREAEGRFIPLFMSIGRLPNDSGFCAVVRDLTPWKRAEEELTHARSLAERASSQKTDFLARISHEIRTPLNAIIGFSELMMDERFGSIGNERYRDYLRDINRSGNHVLDLVNDLLDISKIEAGEQEMAHEAVSLNETLGQSVAMMQPQANRERVIIRTSLTSKLPDVVADLRSVRQIALNLLSNAIRYTQAGGQVIVSTAYEPSGDVVLRIRDTGIGMTQAEIEQALKPFKQINALKRSRGDGTGLGLPLTKAMVEANRARFAINSTPGDGTLVEVTFPAARVLAH